MKYHRILARGIGPALLLALILAFATCSGSKPVEDSPPPGEGAAPLDDEAAEATGAGEQSAGTGEPQAGAEDSAEAPKDPKAAAAAAEPDGPEDIDFPASKGVVAFPHRMHQDVAGCRDCHHTTPEGERPVMCRSCHVSDPDVKPDKMSRVFHVRCRACHLDSGAGPTKCSECHQKPR